MPSNPGARIAAMADLHVRDELSPCVLSRLEDVDQLADVLVVAGDITESGRMPEVESVAEALTRVTIPTFAVYGNHDRRGLRRLAMRKHFAAAGVHILNGDPVVVPLENGARLGVVGVCGTGGGFAPEHANDAIADRLRNAVASKSRYEAARLAKGLRTLGTLQPDISVVLLHFAPTVSTLGNEPLRKYWMLGNALLGRTIDEFDVDLVVHGHAHLGNEIGQTNGGIPVRNVAEPIIGGLAIYDVAHPRDVRSAEPASLAHS